MFQAAPFDCGECLERLGAPFALRASAEHRAPQPLLGKQAPPVLLQTYLMPSFVQNALFSTLARECAKLPFCKRPLENPGRYVRPL